MRKSTVVHSLLMITSVLASTEPFYVVRRGAAIARQGITIGQPPPSSTQSTQAASSTASASSPPASTASQTTTSSPLPSSSSSSTSQLSTTSSSPSASSSASTPTSTSSSSAGSSSDTSTSQDTVSSSVSTLPQGGTTVVVITPTSTSTTASPTTTGSSDNSIHTGTIVGLSVAGGIAAIAIIAFIVWKVTRKRFSDLDDPDEAIKWPELNRETHVGGGGNEDLSRELSNTYSSGAPSRNTSTLDQSEFSDPYAVPPLPQFNPNQPYHDDPYAASATGYYDPYRGPIPQTFHDGSVDGHESIPMSTYPPGSRSRSPGPGAAYDMGGRGSPAPGRGSPGPGPAYDVGGRGSPAPGRTISPGPAAALGLDRRPSPGPQYALSGQPEMATRIKSPGPNVL